MRLWRVPYPKFGEGPGLERVRKAADQLGIDLAEFGRSGAVVVGSNGKGSTAAMAAALLEQAGAPIGLFTSPHLFDLNERFRIDGEDIADDDLAESWERVAAAVERAGEQTRLGGFEFLFLIAADWFAARKCRHTVWEAGIGGRFDPVRLIQARAVALTALDIEHAGLLGGDLEEIARNKIDAAPAGARVFVSESCLGQRAAIEAHAHSRGLDVHFVSESALGSLTAPLAGAHQRRNAALALALASELAPLDEAAAARGLAATRWAGRLETVGADPLVVVDVGHTPDAVQAALEGFQTLRGPRAAVLVCGVSADKDVEAIVAILAPSFATIVAAAARHKGAAPARIAAAAQAANPDAEIIVSESVADARRIALSRARSEGAVYVAGGLFLAAEFRALHLGRDPASLAFF